MAEALLQVVLDNLNSMIQREFGLLWGVDKEMKNLSSKLSTIKAVLEDAELKQLQEKPIKIWLRKLKQAVYDIDDVLDEGATEAARLKEPKGQKFGSLSKVRHYFLSCYSPLDNVLFRHKIGNKMKEINEKLNAIADERRDFHLHEVVVASRVGIPEWRETSSVLTEDRVYGRENDKESVIEQLVIKASDCQDVSILPILGIGGLGKTTLAQQVFNDERVIKHFEPRIWVCISEDFEVKRVIKLLIESVSGKSCDDLSLDILQRQLQDKLNGKRYLVVLDDVWNENRQKWEMVKCVLPSGSKGASVITTTRLENVALIMRTLPIYRLTCLSEDDCWLVFKQQAFKDEGEDRSNLVAIGKEIVKKCRGVALAAKALGSLLQFKNEESEWVNIKESKIWGLPQDEYSIMPALRLSYYNLPFECRQCFAYCAMFEKDSRIEKDRIIHLWMASGFISSNGTMELEDIGNAIWKELYSRSFFQEVENDDFGNIQSFKIHDLVHDLAESIMEDECHVMKVERSNDKQNHSVRHVTLVDASEALENVKSLRKLFVKAFSHDFTKFSTLRVLNVNDGTLISKLPSSIGNLIHLRYLNLSHNTMLTTLPESLCNLLNLQTLYLNRCLSLKRLPNHMGRMINLRHLFMEDCYGLTEMAPEIGQLTNLKSLSIFIVGELQLGELQVLNLGGKLYIKHLERVENWVDAREAANLEQKKNLYSLRLGWNIRSESENAERVLDALKPHPNLKELIIEDYPGTSFPRWMSDLVLLQNLVRVSLYRCKNCQSVPPYSQLRWLKHLEISHMPSLERLSREEEKDVFPCLSQLIIYDCPKLTFMPCLPSLKYLRAHGGSDVLLSSISNLSALESLNIRHCHEIESLPEQGLQGLNSLRSLEVYYCRKLKSLSEGLQHLKALESLSLRGCDELVSLPEGIKHLHSLRNLEISSNHKLVVLPEALQHVPALQSLHIDACGELTSLPDWLGNLASLQSLSIGLCPKVESLPDSIQSLTNLTTLSIWKCGEQLKRRCEKGSREDWYKIQHIPSVYIYY
ncbi:putative disease resistance protein RGA3 [Cornus florida]|uniref:putative disease resistance protein RGA3 n=1 Tax=Cornus florida TaxID=4283 RepID=UPI002899EEC1|nr:putative disease resistance protein RGA3 [Cornus florida]XP_059656958.1 putative disease resistance protein RGA3 [Cornus florida]XP_059656959.1 putative disease resistance protein RGA3 [Cornus florida]XP_059656960.1 putative disease resistance protein RGA3 [Cornus florida]XP_059656961.1 putative disease resistance protein RGA3 [Cornus florida]XP_059656962.1 putative disease resistance protein RGA3 [Cornus florida]